jgi:sulfide:quinone oxidoreductase
MQIKKINDRLTVAGQISAADVEGFAKAGFKSIICNRPDEEEDDQPAYEGIARAAQEAGLEIRYLPIEAGTVTEADAADFAKAMAELQAPVLAYCRSGARCTIVWNMSQNLKQTS